MSGGGVQTRKTVEDKSIPEAVATTSFGAGREVLSMNKILKIPQTGGSPAVFSARKDKNICHGRVQKRKTVADKSISKAVTTPSFGAGRGFSVKKKNQNMTNVAESLAFFFQPRKNS